MDRTFDVSFRLTVPESADWQPGGYGEIRDYLKIDPGIDEPYIVVPSDATIKEVTVLPEGFYSHSLNTQMFHRRKDGSWYFWDGDCWEYSTHTDETISPHIRLIKSVDSD